MYKSPIRLAQREAEINALRAKVGDRQAGRTTVQLYISILFRNLRNKLALCEMLPHPWRLVLSRGPQLPYYIKMFEK